MENAGTQIMMMPSGKAEIANFVDKMICEIDAGIYSPLDIYIRINALTKATELIKEKIRDWALYEFAKHNEKTVILNGAEIQQVEAGQRYDYIGCGDSQYSEITKKLMELSKQKSEREMFLKNIPVDGIELTDENTGEIGRVYPPAKSSTTTLKITFK